MQLGAFTDTNPLKSALEDFANEITVAGENIQEQLSKISDQQNSYFNFKTEH